jgi:hypothetical protein
MDQSTSASSPVHCPQCSALLSTGKARCWLCGADVSAVDLGQTTAELARTPYGEVATSTAGFSLASLMMFITLLCVVLGVSTIAPGVGVPLGLILLVVWARTVNVVQQRQKRGLPMTRLEKLQFFISTAGFALATLVLVGVAGGAALFTVCLTLCATMETGDQSIMILYAIGTAIITVVAIVGIRLLRKSQHRVHTAAAIGDTSDPTSEDIEHQS